MLNRYSRCLGRALGLFLFSAAGATHPVPLPAQTNGPHFSGPEPIAGTWKVEARTSLAWWQVNPHFDHLWATSCPGDPSWQPGDGNTGGWTIDLSRLPKHYRGMARTLSPPDQIPLFPRQEIKPVCGDAVNGQVVLPKAGSWDGATGKVTVVANSVITGNDNRDHYMFSIIETQKYPEFSFRLDRLENVEPGDTLHATVAGTFTLRGVDRPVSVPVKAWREGGDVRVIGKFMIPADELLKEYHMSKYKLGLGVGGALWKELHMGFDLVLVPPTSS